MTEQNQAFLSMIRTSLWGDEFICDKSVSARYLFNEAYRYEVAGITSTHLKDFCGEDINTKTLWTNKALSDIQQSSRNLTGIQYLNKTLENEGIKPVILKGMASASYYDDPMRRSMGDIDFIVPKDYFEKSVEILDNDGFRRGHDSDRHIEYFKNDLEYECHRYITRNANKFEKKTDSIILDMCKSPVTKLVEGMKIYSLPDEGNGLVMLQHMRLHIYGGLGFRPLIDWIVFADKVADDKFWNGGFGSLVKECGLEKFAKVVTKTAQKHLGLKTQGITWCNDIPDELCDDTIEFFFTCNNFGYAKDEDYHIRRIEAGLSVGLLEALRGRAFLLMPEARDNKLLVPVAYTRMAYYLAMREIKNKLSKKDAKSDTTSTTQERKPIFKNIGL